MLVGRGGWLTEILDLLAAAGIKVEVAATTGPEEAGNLARQAVVSGCQAVIACGGDGTINEVIGGMAKSRVPLLVLRGGTANVLARELALPHEFWRCAVLIKSGVARRISLGKAGDRYFVLMAGIGIDAGVVAALNRRLKLHYGETAFWIAGFQQLAKYHFAPFELRIDGKAHWATFAVISKARNYGGAFQLTPKANLFANEFQICLFQSLNRWRYLYYLSHAALGRHARLPDVAICSGRTVEALGTAQVRVQVDGELAGSLPQKFTIEEDALSLIVPRTRSTDS
jgi:diacylglycerol kinase (ATP)